MRIITILISLSLTLLLSNCVSYDLSRRIVQQGNLLPQEKIAKLHAGMSKNEVAILMGNSLTGPLFNDDRWDYAYTWRKGSSRPIVKHVSIYFARGVVTNVATSL
jgi:outer membrane protein assembly factor BamE